MGALTETLKKYKYLLGFTVGIVVLFFVYSFFFKDSASAPDKLTTASPEQSELDAVTTDLLALLLSLKTLDIDTTIFSDDRFKSLTDFSVELIRQPVGRPNPFLPIDGSSFVPQQNGTGVRN